MGRRQSLMPAAIDTINQEWAREMGQAVTNNQDIPPEQLKAVAASIGIVPERDPRSVYFMWIADFAFTASLPDSWIELEDDNGGIAYYNPKLKKVQKTHPVLDKFQAMYEKQKAFMERANTPLEKMEANVGALLNESLNRAHRELPAVTPEIMEQVALLMNVNTSVEYALARAVKNEIDLFVEAQYDKTAALGTSGDPLDFINSIRKEQVTVDVTSKPEDVIMCSHFEDRPATLKCNHDFFSREGLEAMKKMSKRYKSFPTEEVEQLVCSVFHNRVATCEVDGVWYSDEGYEEALKKNPGLRRIFKRILGGLKCSEYPSRKADVLVEDTLDFLSWEGFYKLYRRRGVENMSLLYIDAQGNLSSNGELLPVEEASSLIDKARYATEGGPWLAFRDDQMNAYWYHLADKVTTTVNPYFASS
eukprot:CAMPEP_0204342406 /NCGR_PEP_ID=MMETSP0469-20131031/24118_1 /ASSEMBLY_ACC=CAM_ASM_000384 /TAXON_ID=2969 /ORGANISM="Oxyrrhis marina" /LENGTH=418 /DNA_ID=CAMNT_0051327301 /DNA_START=6 /DNA_END=1262 /DNA_ORIENTATION=-